MLEGVLLETGSLHVTSISFQYLYENLKLETIFKGHVNYRLVSLSVSASKKLSWIYVQQMQY